VKEDSAVKIFLRNQKARAGNGKMRNPSNSKNFLNSPWYSIKFRGF
jgi:hypothetical protein